MVIFLILPFLDPQFSMAATIIHALFHLAADHVLAIQLLSLGSADEKLGNVCVRSSICHGQDARTLSFRMTFSSSNLSIDGLAAHAIMASEVTSLAHKSWNNSVKAGTISPQCSEHESFLLSLELSKELKGDTAQGLPMVSDLKEPGAVDSGGCGCLQGSSDWKA
ncbi:hypothetical protein mRhiFer1_010014 [Rhinolophus ferrumequinum]|uniref:Uncharacterized protein n=1 Tax=Rhinolophus ferrumequinum TaxID=59479 RepID=A0A7J7Y6D9_RHIFE|nr:hypothetical protein mRhiFer1_010014 [Rhinolophus ferrumequinum]